MDNDTSMELGTGTAVEYLAGTFIIPFADESGDGSGYVYRMPGGQWGITMRTRLYFSTDPFDGLDRKRWFEQVGMSEADARQKFSTMFSDLNALLGETGSLTWIEGDMDKFFALPNIHAKKVETENVS